MKSDDSTFGYVSVNALMEFARNHVDKKVDCNDIARFPRSNVRNADEQQSLQQIFGIPFARLRELAEAEREGKIKIGSDWTPCAEGLPTPDAEENGVRKRYLCTTSTPSGKFVVVELIYITIGEKPVWYDNDYYELFEGSGYQVMAWQPLPAPYNPDRKEDAKSDDVSQWPEWKQRAALSNYDFKKEDSE